MDPDAVVALVGRAVDSLDLLATLPGVQWGDDDRLSAGPPLASQLIPCLGAALPCLDRTYANADFIEEFERFFGTFDGVDLAAVWRAFRSSFDAVLVLPSVIAKPRVAATAQPIVSVQLGTPLQIGRSHFLWVCRNTPLDGEPVEEHYWVCVDPQGTPQAPRSGAAFGVLEPWTCEGWRREPSGQ